MSREDHLGRKLCEGIKSSGYWKGHACGAWGKYEHKGKWYCANHYVVAIKTDKRED